MRDMLADCHARIRKFCALATRTVAAALDAMTHEHMAVDVAVAELVEQWDAIAREPSDARCFATYKPTVWLDRHLLAHLHDEEARIFAALDRLPRAQWDAIVAEMKARRR